MSTAVCPSAAAADSAGHPNMMPHRLAQSIVAHRRGCGRRAGRSGGRGCPGSPGGAAAARRPPQATPPARPAPGPGNDDIVVQGSGYAHADRLFRTVPKICTQAYCQRVQRQGLEATMHGGEGDWRCLARSFRHCQASRPSVSTPSAEYLRPLTGVWALNAHSSGENRCASCYLVGRFTQEVQYLALSDVSIMLQHALRSDHQNSFTW